MTNVYTENIKLRRFIIMSQATFSHRFKDMAEYISKTCGVVILAVLCVLILLITAGCSYSLAGGFALRAGEEGLAHENMQFSTQSGGTVPSTTAVTYFPTPSPTPVLPIVDPGAFMHGFNF